MTKHFKTTFTNVWNGKQEEIITKVTDRQEERNLHKKAYAQEKAVREFDKTHIRFSENESTGGYTIHWKFETVEL